MLDEWDALGFSLMELSIVRSVETGNDPEIWAYEWQEHLDLGPFWFLDLPRELRYMIYESYFDDGFGTQITSDIFNPIEIGFGTARRDWWHCGGELLVTCKMINEEATPFFLGENWVHLSNDTYEPDTLQYIAAAVPQSQLSAVRLARIDLIKSEWFCAPQHYAMAIGLTVLCSYLVDITITDRGAHLESGIAADPVELYDFAGWFQVLPNLRRVRIIPYTQEGYKAPKELLNQSFIIHPDLEDWPQWMLVDDEKLGYMELLDTLRDWLSYNLDGELHPWHKELRYRYRMRQEHEEWSIFRVRHLTDTMFITDVSNEDAGVALQKSDLAE
ncbi:hypothetical protein MMC25_006847 [Agyrium rufum]|nr:hypothetical protein [Agyrium rufum]